MISKISRSHSQAKLFQFIYERDIHAAKDIFEQLHHFRSTRRAHRNYFRNDLRVHACCRASTGRIHAADDLGNLRQSKLFIAGIFAFRRESQVEIRRNVFTFFAMRNRAVQTSFFEDWQHQFFGCPGIRGALKNDELAALEVGSDGQRRFFHIAEVRFATLVERSRNADQNGVHIAQTGEIGRGIEMFWVHVSFDLFRGDMLDVGLSGIQLIDLGLIEVESGDALANVGKPESERKSHVTAADNSDLDSLTRKKLRFPLHACSPCACYSNGRFEKYQGLKHSS